MGSQRTCGELVRTRTSNFRLRSAASRNRTKYRDDLKHLPDNGWSLFGLAQTLRALGKTEEAAKYQAKFEQVFAKADVKIKSSCMCQESMTMAK